jgi:hypothetical protein
MMIGAVAASLIRRDRSHARCRKVMSADNVDRHKRGGQRHRTLKSATISFKNGQFTYQCTVRNLSETGAQLTLESTDLIPNRFELIFEDHSPTRTCDVVWRAPARLGVRFETAPAA